MGPDKAKAGDWVADPVCPGQNIPANYQRGQIADKPCRRKIPRGKGDPRPNRRRKAKTAVIGWERSQSPSAKNSRSRGTAPQAATAADANWKFPSNPARTRPPRKSPSNRTATSRKKNQSRNTKDLNPQRRRNINVTGHQVKFSVDSMDRELKRDSGESRRPETPHSNATNRLLRLEPRRPAGVRRSTIQSGESPNPSPARRPGQASDLGRRAGIRQKPWPVAGVGRLTTSRSAASVFHVHFASDRGRERVCRRRGAASLQRERRCASVLVSHEYHSVWFSLLRKERRVCARIATISAPGRVAELTSGQPPGKAARWTCARGVRNHPR